MRNLLRLLSIRDRITRERKPAAPGTCTECGCTDSRACVRGKKNEIPKTCRWANEAHTLCTFCLPAQPQGEPK